MLLFLFIAAVLIAVLGLLTAMFGPGNTQLKYSTKTGTDASGTNRGKRSLFVESIQRRVTLISVVKGS